MKDASRLLRKLRRKVYRETPVATWNRVAEVDWRGSYDNLISTFRRGDCGVLSGGAAFALWRAATDAGFRAWCYDFGFPESLTHMVTVVELDGRFRVHDPFLNLEYRADFYEILEGLRADRLPDIRCEARDRKIYVVDPSCESQLTVDWLTAHADRELDRVGSLRRFEVLWDRDALLATLARLEAVYRDLETGGYPADLSYLMLHPIGVFDGRAHHQNPETMPLIGGRDLRSPVAGLRAAMQQLTQDLAVERDRLAEKSTISGRLESELAEARSQLLAASGDAEQLSAQSAQLRAAVDDSNRRRSAERQALSQENSALGERRTALETELAEARSQLLAASGDAEQLSAQSAQLRAAIDDSSRQWDAERQALSQGNSALEERRAVLEAELAEATAHRVAATEEMRRLADQVVQLRSAYDDAERRIAEERELFLQRQQKLEAALGETSAHAAAIEAQAQEWEQTIRTLQDATDQRTAEWEVERLVLQTAAQALEDDKQRLQMQVANTQAVLVTAHGQIAEMHDTRDRHAEEWDGERRSLQEARQALADDKQQLQTEVANTRADLVNARTEIAELRDTLDRRAAEWAAERGSLQEAARALENDRQELQAEVVEAWEDLAKAHGQISEVQSRLADVEHQAGWSALQIAELVEKDAAGASELAREREEINLLGTRLVTLQSDLRSAEAELNGRDAAAAEFVAAAQRLLALDVLPSTDPLAVLGQLRQQLRKTERELDRAESERDRLHGAPHVQANQRRPTAVKLRNFWRRLLARRADLKETLNVLRGGT